MDTAASAVNDNTADSDAIPQYGSKPKQPGLYLGLFHGRHHPRDQMTGWGFDGPAIGPLRWCHTTYASDIKIEFACPADAIDYFGVAEVQFELNVDADLLVFGGMYYGDWTVYYVEPDRCARPEDTFRPNTRTNGMLAHRKYLL